MLLRGIAAPVPTWPDKDCPAPLKGILELNLMIGIYELSIFTCAVLVQMLGIASVFFARCCERSRAQNSSQRCFYCCLCLVGCAALGAVLLGNGYWLSCGTTLALMAVGVTFDRGVSRGGAVV